MLSPSLRHGEKPSFLFTNGKLKQAIADLSPCRKAAVRQGESPVSFITACDCGCLFLHFSQPLLHAHASQCCSGAIRGTTAGSWGPDQLAHGSVLGALCLATACLLKVCWSLSGCSCSVLLRPGLLQQFLHFGDALLVQ